MRALSVDPWDVLRATGSGCPRSETEVQPIELYTAQEGQQVVVWYALNWLAATYCELNRWVQNLHSDDPEEDVEKTITRLL